MIMIIVGKNCLSKMLWQESDRHGLIESHFQHFYFKNTVIIIRFGDTKHIKMTQQAFIIGLEEH